MGANRIEPKQPVGAIRCTQLSHIEKGKHQNFRKLLAITALLGLPLTTSMVFPFFLPIKGVTITKSIYL